MEDHVMTNQVGRQVPVKTANRSHYLSVQQTSKYLLNVIGFYYLLFIMLLLKCVFLFLNSLQFEPGSLNVYLRSQVTIETATSPL